MKNHCQSCSRCVLDTTVPEIKFDEEGVCQYCKSHDLMLLEYPRDKHLLQVKFDRLIGKIKQKGRDKKHDCIVGVSGGTDSTYVLYIAKKNGLRPLAVHFDDGWDSDFAVTNIKNATSKLDVDLYTYVVDWEEIKALQLNFFKASVPDPGVPTDVAIHGALYKVAIQEKVKYILGGQSFMTEGTQPRHWSYIDGTYVKSLNRIFAKIPLKTYPNATIYQIAYYLLVKGIKQIPLLNYMFYDKSEAGILLERELDWKYYGGHHYESIYSQFINAYYDIKKFNIDRRKVSLSGPVRMGYITREEALEELKNPPPITEEMIGYCIKKLGLSKAEFSEIMSRPTKSFADYHTSYAILKKFSLVLKFAVKMKLVTPVLYEKYLG